jgi:hypothetical protein
MNAIWAPPKSDSDVAASCASAITSPSGVSPDGDSVRPMAAVIRPTTWFLIGSDSFEYLSMIAWTAGSGVTSRVTGTFAAFANSTSPERRLSVRSKSVIRRPNDDALVTSLPAMRQL